MKIQVTSKTLEAALAYDRWSTTTCLLATAVAQATGEIVLACGSTTARTGRGSYSLSAPNNVQHITQRIFDTQFGSNSIEHGLEKARDLARSSVTPYLPFELTSEPTPSL